MNSILQKLLADKSRLQALDEMQGIMTLSPDGFITSTNETCLKIFNLNEEDVISKHHSVIFDPIYARSAAYKKFLQELLEGKIPSNQNKHLTKGDREIWVQNNYTPIKNDKNEIKGLLIATSDITQQKKTERELKLITKALDSSYCIAKFELDGTIIDANENFLTLFGYRVEEVAGKHHSIFCKQDDTLRDDYSKFWLNLRSGAINTNQFLRLGKHGSEIWIQSSYCPLIDESGKTIGIIKIATDISLQKKLEQDLIQANLQAEEANKSKDNFLSTMSHELRTPMNVIIGLGNILIDENNLNTQQKEYIYDIVDAGSHLLNLINDVLDLTQITAGKYKYDIKALTLNHPIKKALRILSVLAASKKITLKHNESDLSEFFVLADSFRLFQILINIITNAIKYNKVGGFVEIRAKRKNGRVIISVQDTGIGIEPHKINQLFQPFNRLGAEKTHIEGTGIGLSICKKIIEGMHGSIEVESEYNQGSTFLINLPEALELPIKDHSAVAPNPQSDLKKFRGSNLNILIVEDHAVNQKLIKRQLDILGYNYELQENGLDALNRIKEGAEFDIVLSDINMPIMDGFQLAKSIRSLGFDENTLPIVFLTADVFNENFTQWKEVGANAYLTKPTQLELLEETLFNLLKNKSPKLISTSNLFKPTKNSSVDINVLIKLVGDDKEVVNEFLKEFLQSTTQFKQEITSNFQNKQWDKLGQSAHRLKSSAALIGALQLSVIATQLQFSCSEINTIEASSLVEKLLPELENVCEFINLNKTA